MRHPAISSALLSVAVILVGSTSLPGAEISVEPFTLDYWAQQQGVGPTELVTIPFVETIDQSVELPAPPMPPVAGLGVSGDVLLHNDSSALVRIILVASDGAEFLVYEAYPLTVEPGQRNFRNRCEDSCLLSGVLPSLFRVEIIDATLRISGLTYYTASAQPVSKLSPTMAVPTAAADQAVEDVRALQVAERARLINERIAERRLRWVAGDTPIARMTYGEKKTLFAKGRVPNLQGFEYYVGGIFDVSGMPPGAGAQSAASQWVGEFDWRNRHGANDPASPYYDGDQAGSGWMTSVKSQRCGDCWAHCAVGAVEAQVNLFFNQHIDLDLSEQEMVSCDGGSCRGGNPSSALRYILHEGIVEEACLPSSGTDEPCANRCATPSELISIAGFHSVSRYSEDAIKEQIITNGPITFGISSWWHCMVGVGFQRDPSDEGTLWILKNSWGPGWGENGYGYVRVQLSDVYLSYAVERPVVSLNVHRDVECHDRDGDGFYNWGLYAEPPGTCPAVAPVLRDCDDSDPTLGPYADNGGCLLNLSRVNELVSFEPDPSSFYSTLDTSGCPDGFVGKFGFDADLKNVGDRNLTHLYLEVEKLTNGNMLLNHDQLVVEGGLFPITRIENVVLKSAVHLRGASFFEGGWGRGQIVDPKTVVDGDFSPRGQQWDQGAVWWDSRDGRDRYIEIRLDDTYTIESLVLQADDNDAYEVSYWDLGSDRWRLAWAVPNFDEVGIGMQTRPNSLDDTERYALPTPVRTNALLIRGDMSNSDRLFSVSELQAYGRVLGDYADGALGPGESTDVPFTLCLRNTRRFRFYVNVMGMLDR